MVILLLVVVVKQWFMHMVHHTLFMWRRYSRARVIWVRSCITLRR